MRKHDFVYLERTSLHEIAKNDKFFIDNDEEKQKYNDEFDKNSIRI